MSDTIKDILKLVTSGKALSFDQARTCFTEIMDGEWSDAQIAALLTSMAQRGETYEELWGASHVLRQKAKAISAPINAVDCCGTGGDGASTLNISTAVAFVLAAAGIPVAKHGNRAASSKSGAADVLEALGVPLSDDVALLEAALKETGYCFLMAPHHHSATKHVVGIRKDLGFRTLFNLMGPLSNPAGVENQLIGVFDKKWLEPMAHVLKALGTKNAWLVCGRDGLDEITITDDTDCVILHDDGTITPFTVHPRTIGIPYWTINHIRGGDAAYNAKKLDEVLNAKYTKIGENAYFDIICLNAAAVLMMMKKCVTLEGGLQKASELIANGKAKAVLDNYKNFLSQAG